MKANKRLSLEKGLTLIEVLIALAIVGIALTAAIKASSQSIRSTAYLQEKTMAMWIAQSTLNEIRAGVIRLPAAPEKMQAQIDRFGRNWFFVASRTSTANKRIDKLTIKIFNHADFETQDSALIDLETYVYKPD